MSFIFVPGKILEPLFHNVTSDCYTTSPCYLKYRWTKLWKAQDSFLPTCVYGTVYDCWPPFTNIKRGDRGDRGAFQKNVGLKQMKPAEGLVPIFQALFHRKM